MNNRCILPRQPYQDCYSCTTSWWPFLTLPPLPTFSEHVGKNLHFLLWEHMDFNGSEIWLTFIVSTRININGNCWKSSSNESVAVLSKEGRIWFIKLTLKICLYMSFFFLISPSSFSRSLISLSENKLFDTRESEDSFWAFVHQAGEVEVYLSHISSAGPRKSLSVLPVACLNLAIWM